MPESPDFEQLALAAIDASFDDPSHVFSFPKDVTRCQRAIVEQLRQVWNARGAADAHAVEEKLATLTGWVSSEPYRQHLREAIETLNR